MDNKNLLDDGEETGVIVDVPAKNVKPRVVVSPAKEVKPVAENPALEELDKKINPRLSKEIRAALVTAPNPSDNNIFLAGERAGFAAPDDLIAQIKDLENKYLAASEIGLAHIPRAAADKRRADLENSHNEVLASGSVDSCSGRSLEDYEAEFRAKMKSAFKLASTYGPQAREILQPFFARYISMCRAYADMLAQSQQQLCEKLGLPWVPAFHIVMVYKCADAVEEHAGRGHSPAECASFLFRVKTSQQ